MQPSQDAVANLQPRSSQEQQRRLIATTTSSKNPPPSAQPPQQRPNSSQAALASSQPRSQGYQRSDTTAYIPLEPRLLQNVLPSSQSHSQEYRFIPYGGSSSAQSSRIYSHPQLSQSVSHPDDFSKPISYVRDLRSQDNRPNSSNNASYTGPEEVRSSFLFNSLGRSAQQPMQPQTSRDLLPSPDFGNHSYASSSYGARPVSAPETLSDSQLMDSLPISQMLPPQRVLPFPEKPPSRDINAIPASSKESSMTKKAGNKVTKPKKGRASAKPKPSLINSLPSSSAPTGRSRKATVARSSSDRVPSSSAPPRKRTAAQKEVDGAPASCAPPKIHSTLEALERTVSKITKDLTPPSSRSGNERGPLSTVGDSEANERQSQPSNRESPPTVELPQPGQLPNILPNIQPEEYLDHLDEWIRKYHDLPVPKAPVTAKEQLANYAAKPDEARAKIIDDMILECLQDENFGKLCDDVERNWKRICPGSQ